MTRRIWVAVALAIAAPRAAIAQPEPAPLNLEFDPDALVEAIAAAAPGLENVVRGTFRRGRRAISIGPTAGVYGAAFLSPRELDVAATFGLGVEMFKIPVLPSLQNLKAMVKERAKAKLKQAVKDVLQGGALDPGVVEQLVREAWDEAVREILGLEDRRPRRMEKPRLTLAIEGNYLVRSETWMTRLRVGVGVWKLTVAATATAGFTDPDTSVFVGPEVVAHILMSKGARASVVDVFVRADFELRNRDVANTDTVVLGMRYLLDIL